MIFRAQLLSMKKVIEISVGEIRISLPLRNFFCEERRLRGGWFEPHKRQCIMSSGKTLEPLLSTGSAQENRKFSQHVIFDWENCWLGCKASTQTNSTLYPLLCIGSFNSGKSRDEWKIVDWDVKHKHKLELCSCICLLRLLRARRNWKILRKPRFGIWKVSKKHF